MVIQEISLRCTIYTKTYIYYIFNIFGGKSIIFLKSNLVFITEYLCFRGKFHDLEIQLEFMKC